MSTPSGPNPVTTAWAIWRARRVRRPAPNGSRSVAHAGFQPVLDTLGAGGVAALGASRSAIDGYRAEMSGIDPDDLSERDALAFWLNVYNAGAIDLAAEAFSRSEDSVLRVPRGFEHDWITVAGESLTLTEIEHGKIRRFKDPRIHGALVCGSASCPTLRLDTYRGGDLDAQLDDQLVRFLRDGGAVADRGGNRLHLSRVFLWYGGDFVRPRQMPTWRPPRRTQLTAALAPWLEPDVARWAAGARPRVSFQTYDWSLACAVG